MSNEKNRDVQDLIAEFVSSKDQLLHEEIISSIKRESFGMVEELPEEKSEKEETTLIIEETVELPQANSENKVVKQLEDKITELNEENRKLQEELIVLQMKETQENASGKSINADDLRMEFLNFTSAHIQQFNTRIKRTEEMIESHISKTQNQPEKKSSSKSYPVWLFWVNLITLGIIACYFLYKMFSGNTENTQTAAPAESAVKNEIKQEITKPAVSVPVDKKVITSAAVSAPAQVVPEKNSPEIAANNSTPFHAATNEASEKPKAAPVSKTVISSPAPKPAVTTQQSAQVSKPALSSIPKPVQNKSTAKTESSASRNLSSSASKDVYKAPAQKQTVTPAPKQPTEKKTAQKDKVYFGED